MRRPLVAFFVACVGLASAHAQNAPEPGAPSTPPPSAAPSEAPPSEAPPDQAAAPQPSGKEVRANCRADAIAKGLKGAARKAAIQDCFAKARPDLAKRNQCRAQGKAQGLADKQLHQFVRQCLAGG